MAAGCNAAASKVVRRKLHRYMVSRNNANQTHAGSSRNVSGYAGAVVRFDQKHRVWERLDDLALYGKSRVCLAAIRTIWNPTHLLLVLVCPGRFYSGVHRAAQRLKSRFATLDLFYSES